MNVFDSINAMLNTYNLDHYEPDSVENINNLCAIFDINRERTTVKIIDVDNCGIRISFIEKINYQVYNEIKILYRYDKKNKTYYVQSWTFRMNTYSD